MNDSQMCTIDLDERYLEICRIALSLTHMILYDLETDFSRSVYNANLISLDELDLLINCFNGLNPGDTVNMNEAELVLLISAHYIANCFTQNGEAFFKWFLHHDKGEVDTTADFRSILQNSQMASVFVIKNSGYYDEVIETSYNKMLHHFGPCRDHEGHETV